MDFDKNLWNFSQTPEHESASISLLLPSLYVYHSLKQTLHCIIPVFHQFVVPDWNYVPVMQWSVWLYHLISQINKFCRLFCLVSDKSWKVCQEQSNGVNGISLNNRVYDSELVTIKILYFNYIHFMQKVLHLCPNM